MKKLLGGLLGKCFRGLTSISACSAVVLITNQVCFEREHDFGPHETNTDIMDRLSREALDGFNENHSTKYEFVKVVKANYHSLMGILFYITFEGKLHSSDDDSEVFQAKVWGRYSGSEVISCELKPKEKKVHSSSEALEKDDPKKPRLTT